MPMARLSGSGTARTIAWRSPVTTSNAMTSPSATITPIASAYDSRAPPTSWNATTAFRPIPGASASGSFDTTPMITVITAATRAVEVSSAPARPGPAAAARICGFTNST